MRTLEPLCRRHPLRSGFTRKPSVQTTTIPAVKLHTTGTSIRQVMMSCVNVLFSCFLFFPFRSKPCAFHQFQTKTCMSHFRSKNTRGWSPSKDCQITATDQPKLLTFRNTRNLGQILVGGLRLKVCPHQTNLKILPAIQPPRRHLAPSPPRMRRRQLRANLRYRTTLSRLQLSTPRWPNHAETHAFPTRRLFQVSDALPLPSGTQGLPCTTHEETSECLPLES